jgi:hypothetical protein
MPRLTGAASLFFQNPTHQRSTMIRHKNVWISLHDNCHFIARGTKAVIHAHKYSWTPDCYSTHQHESHQLRELTMPTLQTLGNIRSRLATPLHSIDVDSLLHMHHTSRKSQTEIRWQKIVIILITIILLLGLLYFLTHSHFDKLPCANIETQVTESDIKTPFNNLELQNHDRETERNVVFSSYSLQHASWGCRTKRVSEDPESASSVIASSANRISGGNHKTEFVLLTELHFAVCCRCTHFTIMWPNHWFILT